jgi:hypothetical protein
MTVATVLLLVPHDDCRHQSASPACDYSRHKKGNKEDKTSRVHETSSGFWLSIMASTSTPRKTSTYSAAGSLLRKPAQDRRVSV